MPLYWLKGSKCCQVSLFYQAALKSGVQSNVLSPGFSHLTYDRLAVPLQLLPWLISKVNNFSKKQAHRLNANKVGTEIDVPENQLRVNPSANEAETDKFYSIKMTCFFYGSWLPATSPSPELSDVTRL